MSLFNQGDKMYSVLRHKCPKCHEGDLYPTRISSFRKIFTMNDHCAQCGQDFTIEPGFYWGSMYVAYILSSGLMLSGFALVYFLTGWGIMESFLVVLALALLLYGAIFRTSRAIWINFYVHYKKPEAKPEESKTRELQH